MICCYLVYSGYTKNALEALRYYGAVRTKNKKVLIISKLSENNIFLS